MTDVRARDVDRGWAWVVLPAAALSLAIQDAFLVSVGIFQVEFLDTFSGSQGFVALICAFAAGFQVMIGPVAGAMADMFSHRVTMMIGAILKSVGLLLASFSNDLHTLLLLFGLLSGTGAGLCYTPSITVVSVYFHKYRTVANGLTLAAPGIGFLVGPYLLRWLIDGYGWRYAMAAFAALMAQLCVLGALFFPPAPTHLSITDCCPFGCRAPSTEGHATDAFRAREDTNTVAPSEADQRNTKRTLRPSSMSRLEVESGSRTELQALFHSGTDLGRKIGSVSDVEVKAGSRRDLRVDSGSRTNLEIKTGSGTDLQCRSVSRTGLNVSEFGSVMLNQSVGCLQDQEFESTNSSFRQRVTRLLGQRFIWVICLNQLLMMCGHAINVVLYAAFARSAGAAFQDIPSLYTAYGLTISVARVAGGFVFSAIPGYLIHAFLALQVALAAVFAFLPVYGVSLPGLFVGVVLVGVTYGPAFVLLSPIILRYVPLNDLSIAFGIVMLCCGTAFLVAPSIAGITYDVTQSYNATYYIAGSTVGVGALPILLLLFLKDLQPPGVKDRREDKLLSTSQKACGGIPRNTELEAVIQEVSCYADSEHRTANETSRETDTVQE